MIRYRRPPSPAGFPSLANRNARASAKRAITRGKTPEWNDDVWGDHKRAFQDAQHGKCAWCEASSDNHYGAIEHRAPKSSVMRLDVRGTEGDSQSRTAVVGRKTPTICDRGYWWLAYEWENWMFSCERCNAWKRSLFPVEEDPYPTPAKETPYTPLLLDPFSERVAEDPTAHLSFDTIGQVRGLTPRGLATVDTCGLDRESLVAARAPVAARATSLCERLLGLTDQGQHIQAIVRQLLALGADPMPFAGVVRGTVQRELGLSWDDLRALATDPTPQDRRRE